MPAKPAPAPVPGNFMRSPTMFLSKKGRLEESSSEELPSSSEGDEEPSAYGSESGDAPI